MKKLWKWLFINRKKQFSVVPYQCCPVCNGTGKTFDDVIIDNSYQTCKVCKGSMIIPMHVVPFTSSQKLV
jgi:DnaJ-class molecular chaperone